MSCLEAKGGVKWSEACVSIQGKLTFIFLLKLCNRCPLVLKSLLEVFNLGHGKNGSEEVGGGWGLKLLYPLPPVYRQF